MKRVGLAAFLVLAAAAPPLAQQQPRFQSGVELLPIDVTVVDDRGRPIEHLAPADFTVRIDDQPRGVVSAQWISPADGRRPGRRRASITRQPRATTPTPRRPAAGSSSSRWTRPTSRPARCGRCCLRSHDSSIAWLPPTVSRSSASGWAHRAGAISRATGTRSKPRPPRCPASLPRQSPQWSYRVGIGAALAELRGDPEGAVGRDQARLRGSPVRPCPGQLSRACQARGRECRRSGASERRLDDQRPSRAADRPQDGRCPEDAAAHLGRLRSRPSIGHRRVVELGDLAAAARTTIYSLKLEEEPINITEPGSRTPFETQQDQIERRQGLELLAQASRGGLLTLSGTGTGAFDRIESEMSGYLSARRRIDAERSRRSAGAAGRCRASGRHGSGPAGDDDRSARHSATTTRRANAALANPLMLAGVPLRGTAIALRGPDRSKIQVLVHADIEAARAESRVISVAHVILDEQQRAAEGQISDLRIGPAAGTGAALPYTRAALSRRATTVRIAVVDGERVGSVEVPLRAELMRAGALEVTELVVGGPDPQRNPSQPTLGPEVRFGLVQGYLRSVRTGTQPD